MKKPVRFDDEAAEELDAAARWYDAQRAGLGFDLLAEVREASAQVAEAPTAMPLAPGVAPRLGVRRCAVRRFPYALMFIELTEEIRIVAVARSPAASRLLARSDLAAGPGQSCGA